jgi:hypothetical protein
MTAMAGLGFMMKYVLLPGRESISKYGRRVDLSFLGLDRNDWGAIHLYLGFLLLALLTLHIVLHWHMIPGLFTRLIANSRKRWQIRLVYVAVAAILLLFPFFISPEVKDAGTGGGRRYGALGETGWQVQGQNNSPHTGRLLANQVTDTFMVESGFDFAAGGKSRP